MGIVRCYVCGNVPLYNIFYVWSSSNKFPLNNLYKKMNVKSKLEKKNLVEGREVCMQCYFELINGNK